MLFPPLIPSDRRRRLYRGKGERNDRPYRTLHSFEEVLYGDKMPQDPAPKNCPAN